MGQASVKKAKETLSDGVLIQRILERNISEYDLMQEFEAAEATIRKYKADISKQNRSSELRLRLEILEHTLTYAEQWGLDLGIDLLRRLNFRGKPLTVMIREFAKSDTQLVMEVIDSVIEQEAATRDQEKSWVEIFRKRYEYLNDETLRIASHEKPELLVKMIGDKTLQPTTRADIIEALGVGARAEYYTFIKKQMYDTSPHLREAAANALFEYFSEDPVQYQTLVQEFHQLLQSESAKGVQANLKELLGQMSEM
ncbi:MAG: hypothetical protein AAGB31_11265 [Bdellovibrio sp.]